MPAPADLEDADATPTSGPAPLVGENTAEVLIELGYSQEEIRKLAIEIDPPNEPGTP